MAGMDERKFRILQAIIDDYILTAMPVGSRTISKKYDMGLSSATIRNEMSDLEELGYLDQPHVSAGRVPSAKAYRLYVDELLRGGLIADDSAEAVRSYFTARSRQMEDVIEQAAQVLSSLTNYTAVVLEPGGVQPRIRNLQLVPVSDQTALMVIVTDSGVVRDTVVRIPARMDADTLYSVSRSLTEALAGCTLQEACERMPTLTMGRDSEAEEKLMASLEGVLSDRAAAPRPRRMTVGGASNMLTYPEYNDMEKARGLLSVIEARDRLARIIQSQGDVAFTVRIGPETGVPEMSDCSIVTATYTTRQGRHGTLGVIGPTRMQYGRVLSILSIMGQQLSELLGPEEDSPPRDESRK